MGFSEGVLVKMADGTIKQIKDVKVNDYILNMNNRPVKVIKKFVETKPVVMMQFTNSPMFRVTTDQLFYCGWDENNSTKYAFKLITGSNYTDVSLKTTSNIFTTRNEDSIILYDASDVNLTEQVYTLRTNGINGSYYINNVIVKN